MKVRVEFLIFTQIESKMKLPTIPYLAEAFSGVLRRFPLVMLSAATGVVAAMMLIERSLKDHDDDIAKVLITAALGLPLLLDAAIAAEKWKLEGIKKWLPSTAALGLLVLYFLTLDLGDNDPGLTTMFRFFGLNLAAHLLVAYLPYLDATPVEDFWEYNKRLFGNFMVGAFYSLVIYAGLSVAVLAVDNLFDLKINDNIYGHLFVFIAGIFNTSYFLANFPRRFEGLAEQNATYTIAVKNLSKFILIPIVGIYFLILYAYSVKILGTWELPKGWVSSLVLGFSIAGIFTYLLNYLLVKFDDSGIVRGFRRWFFFVLLPMVVLLFVAIGRRLSDYGVTEERFIVATAGVWLLLMSVYFIVSKKDNIKFIPISLTVFALLTVLGPFSAFEVSQRSQVNRLEALLTKNNMLEAGRATPPEDTLPEDDAENIYSILQYLREYEHFAPVAPWFGLPAGESSPDWETLNKISDDFKLNAPQIPGRGCNIYFTLNQGFEISGYDTLFKLSAYRVTDDHFSGLTLSIAEGFVELREEGDLQDKFDLQPYLKTMHEKYDCAQRDFETEDAIFETSGDRFDAKFITENMYFERKENLELRDWNGILLLRKRQNNE